MPITRQILGFQYLAKNAQKNIPAPLKNVETHSNNSPQNIFCLFLKRFGIKNGFPPGPPAAAGTPRPIFDYKNVSKTVKKHTGECFLTAFRHFSKAPECFLSDFWGYWKSHQNVFFDRF